MSPDTPANVIRTPLAMTPARGYNVRTEGNATVIPFAGAMSVAEFLQGLAFFVLGSAVLFVAPQARRVDMARWLPLLALFAFLQALVAWDGVLGRALLASYLLPPLARSVLLGLGYTALLGYACLTLLLPDRRHRPALLVLPATLALAWLASVAGLMGSRTTSAPAALGVEIAYRYGLALPTGLLGLWGLRRQARRPGYPQALQTTRGALRIVWTALVGFGLLAGGLAPSLALLSRTSLSEPVAQAALLTTALLLTLGGLALTYGLLRTVSATRREIEHWIEGVERSQALAADRERIGRELHDGIIQSIYAAGLMLEGVRQTIPEDPSAAQAQLSRVMFSLNQTIQDIRRYIFDLRGGVPETDLVGGLEALLRDFRVNTLLETSLIVRGEDTHPLGVERRRHILQIAREALANVARHAQARRVEVRLSYGSSALQLQIADDGVGLALVPSAGGQGLSNIRERARLLEGTLDIDSAPGRGVTVTLTVPYVREEMSDAADPDRR